MSDDRIFYEHRGIRYSIGRTQGGKWNYLIAWPFMRRVVGFPAEKTVDGSLPLGDVEKMIVEQIDTYVYHRGTLRKPT